MAGKPGRLQPFWIRRNRDREQRVRHSLVRHTVALELVGTTWLDRETGAVLQFGTNKKLSWIRKPEIRKSTHEDSHSNEEMEEWLEGMAYDFKPDANNVCFYERGAGEAGGSGNPFIADSRLNHEAGVTFNGHELAFWAMGPDKRPMPARLQAGKTEADIAAFYAFEPGFLYLVFDEQLEPGDY